MRKILLIALLVLFVGGHSPVFGAQGDQATMGWDYTRGLDTWRVRANGDLVPGTESVVDIGSSTLEVAEGHFDSIYLGGVKKISWGSVISPMTDATGYVYPTDSNSYLKLYDDGDIAIGGGVETDVHLLYDGYTQDFYMAMDDSVDSLVIGKNSTVGSGVKLTFPPIDSTTVVAIGDRTAYDAFFRFEGADQQYYVGHDDSLNYLVMGSGATMDIASHCVAVASGSSPKVFVWHGIDGYGAVDMDFGSSDITDFQFYSDGGYAEIDGATITVNSETHKESIGNPADDTIRVRSDDSDTTFEIYGTTDVDAILQFEADAGADTTDTWYVKNDDALSNLLRFVNHTTNAMSLSSGGTLSASGDVVSINSDGSYNSVVDVMTLDHNTTGTAAGTGYSTSATAETGIGTGMSWKSEDASGNIQEMGSIDLVCTDAVNASEDASWVFSNITNGTVKETLRIDAEGGNASCDVLQFTSNSEETNANLDIMVLRRNIMSGNGATGIGAGISIEMDDAGGIEEQASIDFILSDGTAAGEDCDIIFKQNIGGSILESVRFNADQEYGTVELIGASPGVIIGDKGEESTSVTFLGNAQQFSMGVYDVQDEFVISNSASIGTSQAFQIDSSLDITLKNNLIVDGGITVTGGDIMTSATGVAVTTNSTQAHKYRYFPMWWSVTKGVVEIGSPAQILKSDGINGVGGTEEVGSTEGYLVMPMLAGAVLRFRFALPETFVDRNVQKDLHMEFDVSPVANTGAGSASWDVNIYERGNQNGASAIYTDILHASSTSARMWATMGTAGDIGFGDDADINADDTLVITVSPVSTGSGQCRFYGARIKYATGIQATQ